jgi:hypothetical protein
MQSRESLSAVAGLFVDDLHERAGEFSIETSHHT